MKNRAFKIRGMDCADEVAILRREIGPLVGGENRLSFDILRGKMDVASEVSASAIIGAVAKTGMKAELWLVEENATTLNRPKKWFRDGHSLLTVISGLLVVCGFLLHAWLQGSWTSALGSEGMALGHHVPVVVRLTYLAAILTGGWFVVPKALFALRRLRPDMNLLMTIAVLGAIVLGEWLEGALVSFLFALSLALETWSVGRARRAVEALLNLAPSTVRVISGGRESEVPAGEVPVGTTFLVRPAARIPLDGEVLEGTSEVNQAPITGESVPLLKEKGATVFAGTINGNGPLQIRSTKGASDTTLARIITLVGSAHQKKAPSEQWVEHFARYYTPIVFAAAIAMFLVPPLAFGASWSAWAYRALVLLVIGCPCALVISTPVSIVAALASSARNGVLIKGGAYVETPARLKAIAMDKTGTLTEGRPRVVRVLPQGEISERELMQIASTMESQNDHPLARAILESCRNQGISALPIDAFSMIQGKGATGTIAGKSYWIGSHRYLEERREETPEIHASLNELARTGHSVVVVGNEGRVVGMIALADAIRPASAPSISELRRLGIEHVVMLTGDNRPTAEAIAKTAGVDEIHAELLPEEKLMQIDKLVEKYGQVAMIGDGVNDAPSMARATLGIAMGAMGSDAAVEAGDIALMSDDLSKLPWLVRHSRRALFIIKENIVLSLAVKAIFVVLTFSGYASLWAAIAADMGVSLLVIVNALRLLHPPSTTD